MKIEFTSPKYVSCGSSLAKIIVFFLISILLYSALTTVPLDFFKLAFAIGASLGLLFLISPWYFLFLHRFPLLPVVLLAILGIVSVLYQVIHQPSNYLGAALFAIGSCFNLLIVSPLYQRIKLQGRTLLVVLLTAYALTAMILLFFQHLASSLLTWLVSLFTLSFFLAWYTYVTKRTE